MPLSGMRTDVKQTSEQTVEYSLPDLCRVKKEKIIIILLVNRMFLTNKDIGLSELLLCDIFHFLEIPSHNSETCSPTAPQSAVTAS